jgi:hypothetical protein
MHRWLAIVIFAYLIFAPILSIIPKMEQPAVVVVLWVIIGARTRGGGGGASQRARQQTNSRHIQYTDHCRCGLT